MEYTLYVRISIYIMIYGIHLHKYFFLFVNTIISNQILDCILKDKKY